MRETADETLLLRQGTILDPANGIDGLVGDLWIRGGRVIEPQAHADREVDLTGLVVMPGGIDLHSHVAGPKVNAGCGRRDVADDGGFTGPAAD